MAEWLNGLEKFAPGPGGLIRNILSPESIPNKVLEVKLDRYSKRAMLLKEDTLFLYSPVDKKHEIVLAPPESSNKVFSLFRSESKDVAEKRFEQFKDKLSIVVSVSKEECNVGVIQKMCDILESNPGWNVAHLAAYCDLVSALNAENISKFLDVADPDTGVTPLLVAIQAENIQTIKALLAKVSLDCLDNEANSVLHYAASTNKEIINIFTSEVQVKCLNDHNAKGHTPLHMACLADKPECVKALILAGADCNISAADGNYTESDSSTKEPGIVGDLVHEFSSKLYANDMKFGGTPLHWSCSREVIESLLEKKCHINAINFDGQSALHLMVRRKRLDCVMALLSHGADTNIADCDGNTPLHLAVLNRNATAVQALIIFGVSLNYKNLQGATARHLATKDSSSEGNKILYILHSVGAERCNQDTKGCTSGCSFTGKFNGTAPPTPFAIYARDALDQILATHAMDLASKNREESLQKRSHALCLDGGGIRGLVLVIMLRDIEQAIGRPVIDCFDWVAGTSTGGILALALAVGKSLQECLCLYFRMKDTTFLGNRPYANEPLEEILKQCFGSDTVMSEIAHPKLMITGLLADRKPVDLHLFRNYESPLQVLGKEESAHGKFKKPVPYQEQFLWEAARASGAAPTYFGAHGRFLDGGLIANNPSLDCMTEIHEYNLALKAVGRESEVAPITAMVSLGTGNIPTTELQDIDVGRPGSLWGATKLVSGVFQITTLIIDQATQSSGRVVDRARSWCSSIGVPFYRFTPQLSEDINMDERSDEKLVNMAWEAQAYMFSQRSVIGELAAVLRG